MGALHCRPARSLVLLTGDRKRVKPANPSRQWRQTKGIAVVALMGMCKNLHTGFRERFIIGHYGFT